MNIPNTIRKLLAMGEGRENYQLEVMAHQSGFGSWADVMSAAQVEIASDELPASRAAREAKSRAMDALDKANALEAEARAKTQARDAEYQVIEHQEKLLSDLKTRLAGHSGFVAELEQIAVLGFARPDPTPAGQSKFASALSYLSEEAALRRCLPRAIAIVESDLKQSRARLKELTSA